ncbi:MAG TPA: efflux RND transporter periplasmic adaptor subunit [Vulgatibacter sp.]|nr:efflux RND transporter periplasmic adaptor subunit [Vulgatibacter sp.]
MRVSKISALLLAPSLLVALASGCADGVAKASLPAAVAEAKQGVRVVTPQAQLDGQLVKATGRLAARNEAAVGAKIGGTIRELLVDVGVEVRKDQPLARLDAANALIAVEQAKAAQAVAQAGLVAATQEWERAQKLAASGGLAKAGLDRAEAAFKQATAGAKQADAGLQAAQRALADHTLRAPFDGKVTARMMNVGEYVAVMPPSPVFRVVDVESLEVILPVPETVVATVRPGAKVRGVVNPSGHAFEATVRVVGDVVDPATRTVEVRADLTGERSPEMRPHAMVEVDFSGSDALEGLFLPAQAVVRDGEGKFVWVVEDGAAVKKPIVAEALSPGVVRVTNGLVGTEQVVSDGGARLADGMQVQIVR